MNHLPNVCPVILAGGSGTRLWPLSRAGFPKQFLCLTGQHSLFQQTCLRLAGLRASGLALQAPCVVGNEEHRFLILEQLREIATDVPWASATDASGAVQAPTVLLEPMGRNTAPALALAARAAMAQGQDPVLVVMPADHVIGDPAAFCAAVQGAVAQAVAGHIAVLGVQPTRAETGYGYIQVPGGPAQAGAAVLRFVEKPDATTAQRYLQEGGYWWNAGLFVLKASVWLQALERFRPDMAQACQAAWAARTCDAPFVRPGQPEFAAIPAESIDYAVMEHCPGSDWPMQMLPLEAGWSDLGAWDAVWDVGPKDAQHNVLHGDVQAIESHHNLVHASSRLVSVVGVHDLVVVETPDAVLVTQRARAQGVKQVVAQLQAEQREEHNLHRKVHRPWGWYDSIDEAERFKVKRIRVLPHASLSLQKHQHRAEHWIVVTGTAEVTCGERVMRLTENQSTYIPLGEVHRLSNPSDEVLEIIEVQSGDYLGEDDIERFEDRYGR